MRKNSLTLIKTNPYLKDAKEREIRLIRSVISSSAIEGVRTAACRACGVKRNLKRAKVINRPLKSS
jgi:hypothetical protein